MQEEIDLLVSEIEKPEIIIIASRKFYIGKLAGKKVILAKSGIGKVASSFTASLLIHKLGAEAILVTGVAGGIADHIKVGDLAIASEAVQHDMDCRPLFPQFEIPLSGISFFKTDPDLTKLLERAANEFIFSDFNTLIPEEVLKSLSLNTPEIYTGRLASGDQFIGTFNQWEKIRAEIMDILFVEMEGAAVAQVCHDSGIPWCSIRTISDKANAVAHIDFDQFLNEAAKLYTAGIVKKFVGLL